MHPDSSYGPDAGGAPHSGRNHDPNTAPGPPPASGSGIGHVPAPGTGQGLGHPPAGQGPPQAGVPGAVPQYALVPQRRSGIPAAAWIGIVLGAALVIGLGVTGVLFLDGIASDTGDDSSGADPVAEAQIGDCFHDYGDAAAPELEATDCGAGAFTAIEIVEGTADPTVCDGLDAVDAAVASTGPDRVLCLSYTAIVGDRAYHAQVGECVHGSSTPNSAWNPVDCRSGVFKIIERIEDESSTSACGDSTYYAYGIAYATGRPDLDVTLCLQMIYASGDAAYAEVDDCLLKEDADYAYFEFVSDCGDANVYVTGRTDSIVDAESWCNGWGWAYEEVTGFPELSYTICWGYL